jgi:DNA-binding LacI/PurR family transcriptional regulator
MITRTEVADRAGVSPATVSNVLNGYKYVSPDLVAKVEKAVRELGYVPNRAARSLASRRTEQVGYIIPNLLNPYFGEVAAGMEEIARASGYVVTPVTAETESDRYISPIIERQMDGVFLADCGFSFSAEQLTHMRARGVSFVVGEGSSVSEGTCSAVPCSRIAIDYSGAMVQVFELLRANGHRRVAFLSGNGPGISEVRKEEFRRLVAEFGFDADPALLVNGEPPYGTLAQDGYRDARKLLAVRSDFTAVFALNDLMAIGAMKALREAGLGVPGDVSVVGCDNIYFAETAFPPLTTIDIPKRLIGRAAMELLLEAFAGEDFRRVEVPTELIVRQSLGPARRS